MELKEYNHLLEIRQVLLLRDAEKKCNATQNHILYFYTIDELCPSCKDQGEILTYIHKQNPVFNVYSFDANIENPAIRQLRNLYDIGQVPALVVNGKPYQGFHSRDQLLSVLESDGVI